MKSYLAAEAAVRGFAATNDPYFSKQYRERSAAFDPLSAALARAVTRIGLSGSVTFVDRERSAYHSWVNDVATAIVSHPRTRPGYLLRMVDPAYADAMLDADKKIGAVLDDASVASEIRRQLFLRQVLFASVVLVLVAASIVAFFLWARERAERRLLLHGALYAEERRVTAMLQLALAPDQLPSIDGIALNAIYVPAGSERAVGGDWYEAFELLDGRVFLLIGDVAGHGLEAAVTMNKARQALLASAVVEAQPAAILKRANAALFAQSAGMVTAACCIFDPRTMRLDYATAGHPAPIIAAPGRESRTLLSGGAPLGLLERLDIATNSTFLGEGWMVILYTDGMIEQQRDVVAGEQRLRAEAERFRTAPDPAAAVFHAVLACGAPRDDAAILTMSIRTATSAHLTA